MAYLISDLKDTLEGIGHGTSVNDLTNFNQLVERAARQVIADCDPPETERISELPNAIYDDVFRTSPPSDLKGESIIDIRPQASRELKDNPSNRRSQEFDLYKAIDDRLISIEHDDGTKYLRLAYRLNKGILLNECESLTANGTWSAAGGASSLASDTVYFVAGGASLKFNVGATGGYIENSTMTAVDLTDHEKAASVFVWLYIPTSAATTALTNVNLLWGSSSSAYYSKTVTTNFDSTAFHIGWNLLQFDWSGLTATGSPTITAYNYLRLTLTTTAAVTNFKVDSFYSRLPSIYEIVYYSKFLFRNTAGTFAETISADSDIINLDTDGYNLLVNQISLLAAQQRGGKDALPDMNFFQGLYQAGLSRYRTMYPSKIIQPQNTYYRFKW